MIPAIIGAIGSLAGGIAGAALNSQNASSVNKQNIALQRETNALNQQMAREQMAWQEQQAQVNREWEEQMQLKQWNRETQYNSPTEVMNRLRAAGVNPLSVFGGQGSPALAQSSVGMPNAPSAGVSPPPFHAIAPQMAFTTRPADFGSLFKDVASSIEMLSKADLNKTTKDNMVKRLSYELNKMVEDTKNVNLQNSLLDINKSIQETFGPLMANANYQNKLADTEKIIADTALSVKNGELIDVKKVTEETQQSLNRALVGLHGEERRLAQQRADTFMQTFRKQLDVMNSEITKNNAAAAEMQANAVTTNEIRPFVSRIQSAYARINENEAAFKDETFVADVEKAMDVLQQAGIITQTMQKQLDLAIKENNWYVARQIIGLACDISNSASQWMPKVNISRESRIGSDDIRGNYYEDKSIRSKSRVGK